MPVTSLTQNLQQNSIRTTGRPASRPMFRPRRRSLGGVPRGGILSKLHLLSPLRTTRVNPYLNIEHFWFTWTLKDSQTCKLHPHHNMRRSIYCAHQAISLFSLFVTLCSTLLCFWFYGLWFFCLCFVLFVPWTVFSVFPDLTACFSTLFLFYL